MKLRGAARDRDQENVFMKSAMGINVPASKTDHQVQIVTPKNERPEKIGTHAITALLKRGQNQ